MVSKEQKALAVQKEHHCLNCPNQEKSTNETKYIKIMEGGPYLVFGSPKFVQQIIVPDEEGASWEYQNGANFPLEDEEGVALCRCGHSGHKPYCDGTHEKVHWDSAETASFKPILDEAEAFAGPNLTLMDNQKYCAYARFCDAKGRVWNLVMEGSRETDELAERETFNCPAGRLMLFDNKTGKQIEPNLEQSLGLIEDIPMECSGPIWVKGGIRVESAKGVSYEVRNRQTLCRCGCSTNKPFCDGSHANVHFQDGLTIK